MAVKKFAVTPGFAEGGTVFKPGNAKGGCRIVNNPVALFMWCDGDFLIGIAF
jgi:hypothetical protein